MVRNGRGINLVFILLLGALLVMVWTSSLNQVQDNYTEGALRQDLEGGLVTGAVIGQNPETPTGSVTVSLSDGRSRTAYVTDVEDAITLLEQYEIDPLVRDVPQESWFMNDMLPVLVMGAVFMIFFFMMMNAQNAGAGASGNKMMNFGKSRARMSTGKDNRITLKDVAGLKERLLHPDADAARIRSSLDWTGRLVDDVDERSRIRELLSSSADLVRLASKLEMKRSVVRDLVAIRQSLYSFFSLVGGNGSYLELMDDEIADGEALVSLADTIGKAINPECTNDRDSGNVILPGFDDELDRLRGIYDHGSALLDDYLEKVRAESGITTLKCSSNRIIGVYLEVPKSQLVKVPDYFIRRQTLVGGERFTTQELSRLEAEINSSQQEAEERERAIYNSIVARAAALTSDLVSIGRLFSRLDVYQCFATVSSQYGYTRPEIVEDGELEIEDGRHPVVEQHLPSGSFVRNGFSTASSRFALITGPNMAGKSTFLRQNALIILMAHAGCFVPAGKAVIPVCDRIFCRVGSSDNLARGESSFLVEMQESSFILRNAGRHSFVIMDEIGRGTSTQDGMSIAYAIMMYLRKLGCITLFATHYHELTMLDSRDIQLLTLSVRQDRGGIVFLRRIMEGVAESSYGLHVARMAGIPSSVIRDAASFQKRHFADYGMDTSASQLDLFVDSAAVEGDEKDRILDEIADFDVSGSTPLEAMLLVTRLQEELRSSGGK